MAPLMDTNHELNWQANMVDAIEKKTASRRNEGRDCPDGTYVGMLPALQWRPASRQHISHDC